MSSFDFEQTDYVCEECGGSEWHANRFFCNSRKQWFSDDVSQWCSDCEQEVGLIEADEWEEEK